ncbi:kunitz-type serine protease inhibitor A-like [Pieris brassicae]|uniref:kunitz-type serine protease inhibitor A-like n=1 Tax=Pieris brassicae TaxID=7116 RepID=UPI001E6620E9|nr:kunitz-type serine protease inhibitor A-like [Pieris brassicae]
MFITLILIFCNTSSISSSINTTKKIDEKELLNINSNIACKMQPNGYDCSGKGKFTPVFYYDILLEDCKTAYIGQCPHQYNTYNNLRTCNEACRDSTRKEIKGIKSPQVYCRLQPDFGRCNSYHPMWFFDLSTRTCKGFSYSGCGGNVNRFDTHQECVSACSELIV